MKVSPRGLAAAFVFFACVGPAQAAPVTVDLRVEGPASTIFEGKATTDVRTFAFTGSSTGVTCDGTAPNGTAPVPSPTRNGALLTALEANSLPVTGTMFSFGPSFSTIGGVDVAFNSTTFEYLVELKNWQASPVGGCSDPIVPGDNVLFAYGTGSEGLLELTGPSKVKPGEPFTVKVVDRAQASAPVAGVAVGGQQTNAAGEVTLMAAAAGPFPLKATKAGFIRSNRLDVCATTGSDGACGTTVPVPVPAAAPAATCRTTGSDGRCGSRDRQAPLASISGLTNGQRFALGQGPRTLSGIVGVVAAPGDTAAKGLQPDPSGTLMVKLRIARRDGNRCSYFSGKRERFIASRCGAEQAKWFRIDGGQTWSYLLPSALPRGRYVIDVNAIDKAYNRDNARVPGRNRMVITVG